MDFEIIDMASVCHTVIKSVAFTAMVVTINTEISNNHYDPAITISGLTAILAVGVYQQVNYLYLKQFYNL